MHEVSMYESVKASLLIFKSTSIDKVNKFWKMLVDWDACIESKSL